jgi:molybdopterin-guanine dinucleotide biosynthesis protein A
MDLVLVNGNHQQAKAQVVIIDINKKPLYKSGLRS